MDGTSSKIYQPLSPVLALLPEPHQEAGTSMSTVSVIPPTRYMPDERSTNPSFSADNRQFVSKGSQGSEALTMLTVSGDHCYSQRQAARPIAHNRSPSFEIKEEPLFDDKNIKTFSGSLQAGKGETLDAHQSASLRLDSDASRKKQKKTHAASSKNKTKCQKKELQELDKGQQERKQPFHQYHTRGRTNKSKVTDQTEDKELERQRNAIREKERRKGLAQLYDDIERAIRDKIHIEGKLSKRQLLLTCIRTTKKKGKQSVPASSSVKIHRKKYEAETAVDEKRVIKNQNESRRRLKIRRLITKLGRSISGPASKGESERIILQKYLSFISEKKKLTVLRTPLNQKSPSGVKVAVHPPEKNISISPGDMKSDLHDKKTVASDSLRSFTDSACSDSQVSSSMTQNTGQPPGGMCSSFNHFQTEPGSPDQQTQPFDSSHDDKEPEGSGNPISPPMPQNVWQNPEAMDSLRNYSKPAWFAESVSELLEFELHCREREQLTSTDESLWSSFEATTDSHSTLSPCQSSSVLSSPEQIKQEEACPMRPSYTPTPDDICTNQPPVVIEKEQYPEDDLPMMQCVSPQEIFPWLPFQHLQDNDSSSVSDEPVELSTGEAPSAVNEVTPVDHQPLDYGEREEGVDEISEPSSRASTPGTLQIATQNEQLINDLKGQVAELQRSKADFERQQIQADACLHAALNENRGLSGTVCKLEQELQMLREENAQLHQKDRLAENLVKFAFQEEQKKTDWLEQKISCLHAERILMLGKISTAESEVRKLKELLTSTSVKAIMED